MKYDKSRRRRVCNIDNVKANIKRYYRFSILFRVFNASKFSTLQETLSKNISDGLEVCKTSQEMEYFYLSNLWKKVKEHERA